MPTKTKRSLANVVADEKKESSCMLCSIPEREEIEGERLKGAEIRHVVEYLIKDCGYPETEVMKQRESRMSKHFKYHSESSS